MSALDFPNSPTGGQTYTGPGGVVWSWDTAKWVNGSTGVAVAGVSSFVNYCDNSGFSVNQRGYASGAALAAGIYGFDRWKAGAGGATLTFTASPPSTTITITAGTLQQVVEGAPVAGGNYMLSWTGTAQGRIGSGSYTVSPVAIGGWPAGVNLPIEFSAGTLSRVKFESGTVATSWLAKPARDELSNCHRFYNAIAGCQVSAYAPGAFPVTTTMITFPPMRGIPGVSAANVSYSNGSALGFTVTGNQATATQVTAAAAGTAIASFTLVLTADL